VWTSREENNCRHQSLAIRSRQTAWPPLKSRVGCQMANSQEVLRGGARIGLANATWPFAQLHISTGRLVLQVTFFGSYSFMLKQVIRVAPFGLIPFFGKGVRIFHRVADYPDKLVFWYLCANPQLVVAKIAVNGYDT